MSTYLLQVCGHINLRGTIIMKRYPEGLPSEDKLTLEIPSFSEGSGAIDTMRYLRRSTWIVPVPDSILSTHSDPKECFVNRGNSKLFQQFMLNYAYSICKATVLSGEV